MISMNENNWEQGFGRQALIYIKIRTNFVLIAKAYLPSCDPLPRAQGEDVNIMKIDLGNQQLPEQPQTVLFPCKGLMLTVGESPLHSHQ